MSEIIHLQKQIANLKAELQVANETVDELQEGYNRTVNALLYAEARIKKMLESNTVHEVIFKTPSRDLSTHLNKE